MRMREYHKMKSYFRNNENPRSDILLSTTITFGDIVLIYLIDFIVLVLFIVARLMFLQDIPGDAVFTVGAWLIFYLLGRTLFGGMTIGMLVTGVRFVSLETEKQLQGFDYVRFYFSTFGIRFQLGDQYELLSFWADDHHQSPAMKEGNVILVKRRIYREFLKEFPKP